MKNPKTKVLNSVSGDPDVNDRFISTFEDSFILTCEPILSQNHSLADAFMEKIKWNCTNKIHESRRESCNG
jgi:hypothetical protein